MTPGTLLRRIGAAILAALIAAAMIFSLLPQPAS
jgi:hypothetical protein